LFVFLALLCCKSSFGIFSSKGVFSTPIERSIFFQKTFPKCGAKVLAPSAHDNEDTRISRIFEGVLTLAEQYFAVSQADKKHNRIFLSKQKSRQVPELHPEEFILFHIKKFKKLLKKSLEIF
jgi:hypothetical protein